MRFHFLVLMLLFLGCNLFAQQYIGDNKIVVEGTSDMIVDANRASFELSIVGFGSSLRNAFDNAKIKVNKATSLLYKFGIQKKNISTSTFESGENSNGKAFLSSSKDFKTFMTMFVIVDSLPNLENIIIGLSESGVDSIYNIGYSLKDFEKYKVQAKDNAVEDAKKKASQLADKFSVSLKKVLYVEDEGSYQNFPGPFNQSSKILAENIPPTISIYAKPVKIIQRIKVVYQVE